jgi:hypothetical protein
MRTSQFFSVYLTARNPWFRLVYTLTISPHVESYKYFPIPNEMCGSMVWMNVNYHSTWTVMKQILLMVKIKIVQVSHIVLLPSDGRIVATLVHCAGGRLLNYGRSRVGTRYNTQQRTLPSLPRTGTTQTLCKLWNMHHTSIILLKLLELSAVLRRNLCLERVKWILMKGLKLKRNGIWYLLEKFEVLDMLDMGMRTADVTPFWCKQINNLCHQEKRRWGQGKHSGHWVWTVLL